jgi:hypothetical protein
VAFFDHLILLLFSSFLPPLSAHSEEGRKEGRDSRNDRQQFCSWPTMLAYVAAVAEEQALVGVGWARLVSWLVGWSSMSASAKSTHGFGRGKSSPYGAGYIDHMAKAGCWFSFLRKIEREQCRRMHPKGRPAAAAGAASATN